MKSILIFDTPNNCSECPCCNERECGNEYKGYVDGHLEWNSGRPSWCPLSHPLKLVSSDFYIYDRKYLFDNLGREIDLLKGAKAFEEFMKARETE